ncbi:methyltransferase domain-containing protein [Aliifodinibius sp. S!AR15-10]|uniref:class I SAM-dependent methyltransferase n=1 Tax=Aliifodinibius sp. S!AR15-10 TaxID=2950437 RepID=UPI002866AE47|nr:methyltransferase domain-containing protein [Aliifodinibius sp. S!AR15-10]MDR8393381.1 methyltransferase domain-containing protein [Aliifodinibius sp. S!AR15-10]
MNATKKMPFPDYSVDYIFAEQFIEHITLDDGKYFINESYRILKNGGVLRLATPDLFLLYQIYLDQNDMVSQKEVVERHKNNHNPDVMNTCHFNNDMFRLWGHQFIYDYSTLEKVLHLAGFKEVNRLSFGESSIDELSNLERHADTEWMKNVFQIILEAKK